MLSFGKFDINKLILRRLLFILSCCILLFLKTEGRDERVSLYFYGDTLQFTFDTTVARHFNGVLTPAGILDFYSTLNAADYDSVVSYLTAYRAVNNPDDWVFYQLLRKVAQHICPKEQNYNGYTLYKWYLLNRCGYSSTLNIADDKLLLYVQSDENIYDIPCYKKDGKQYICLNFHDFTGVDVKAHPFIEVPDVTGRQQLSFSYKLTRMPNFSPAEYEDKELDFSYDDRNYAFKIKVSRAVQAIYRNYPVADYKLYFNAPLCKETYNSLIPQLKEQVKGMPVKNGVDYLMKFTRYAFLYQTDKDNFGKEKRLSPEQTLLSDKSDCEDRAALFYCLVKEIYNLPMVVLEFPQHLTIAVKFDKPVGKPVYYNGQAYTICEPTPQQQELGMGQLSYELRNQQYAVALTYDPR